jgi:hypothetical protein
VNADSFRWDAARNLRNRAVSWRGIQNFHAPQRYFAPYGLRSRTAMMYALYISAILLDISLGRALACATRRGKFLRLEAQ